VVDQRMPVMTGIELLRETLPLQPEAKRVLLTAYADTEVAIDAINEIRLDQYLLKPWDPPEERLYPVLDDLLADWRRTSARVRGAAPAERRWAPRGHAIRDFLTRNQVPYAWHDPTADEEGRRLAGSLEASVDPASRSCSSRTVDRCATRRIASSPTRSACRRTPRCRSTTSSSSAPARPAWPRRSTVPARG
jgi:thioredoxin reductase (NADPH)